MAEDSQAAPLSEAAQVAIAYLGNPSTQLAPEQVAGVIFDIYGAVAGRLGGVDAGLDTPRPAAPIAESIGPDYMICLEDGAKLKMLKRYLRAQHNMSPEEYRAKWGLPSDYPMVAPSYSRQRSALAKQQGLGRKPAAVPILKLRTS